MANHKSAEKRARQNLRKNKVNTHRESTVKTAVKALRLAIDAKDKKKCQDLLVKTQGLIDKLAKAGIIKRETAGRRNSRLATQVARLS